MTAHSTVAPVAEEILRHADATETERRLPDALMAGLKEAGLFSIYTPKQFGGMGLLLVEALSAVEEVARYDGSTGWAVASGFGNDIFTSVLSDEAAAKILGSGSALIAGGARLCGPSRARGRWLPGYGPMAVR